MLEMATSLPIDLAACQLVQFDVNPYHVDLRKKSGEDAIPRARSVPADQTR